MSDRNHSEEVSDPHTPIPELDCLHIHWGYYLAASAIPFIFGISITLLTRLVISLREKRERLANKQRHQHHQTSEGKENFENINVDINNSNSDIELNSDQSPENAGGALNRIVRSKTLKDGTLTERLAITFARTQLFCEMLESGESTFGKIFVRFVFFYCLFSIGPSKFFI